MGQKVTKYALTSGANTAVTPTIPARKVKIEEDETGPPAGIVITWPDGTVAEYGASQQPVILENPGGGSGPFAWFPAKQPDNQSYVGCGINASMTLQVKSVGATSVLRVTEES